jgi:hypothetical protein
VKDLEDEALCAATSFDELGERNLIGRKSQGFQLTPDFRTAVIHDHVFLDYDCVARKSARFLFANRYKSWNITFKDV